jgi:hypothetical protein
MEMRRWRWHWSLKRGQLHARHSEEARPTTCECHWRKRGDGRAVDKEDKRFGEERYNKL